jgi:hypothetical protein
VLLAKHRELMQQRRHRGHLRETDLWRRDFG